MKITIEEISNGWIVYFLFALSSETLFYETKDEMLKAVANWVNDKRED